MLKNYFKVIYRNFIKHKSYSSINILGLSIGIACCILILAYIGYEFSYDRFHKNADDIYRIVTNRKTVGKTIEAAIAPSPLAPMLIKDLPEVVDAVRISPTVKRSFTYQDKHFFETDVLYAGKSFFKVFSFELLEGDPETALEAPFTMVITQETAKKYFGDESPVGKMIKWDNRFEYSITGVVKKPPPNSHFTFNVLASFSTFIRYDPRIGSTWSVNFSTYLLLQENTDHKKFQRKLENYKEKNLGPMLKPLGGELEIQLQPLTKIHLHSNLRGELGVNSDIRIIFIFTAIVMVILLIACINFINLATARSASRAKEVGIRKVLGAERKKLVVQFLGESFIFAVLSLIAAIIMVKFALPYFNWLAGREIVLSHLEISWLITGLVGILLFVGLFAGSYPAFFLSSFKPGAVLKGDAQRSGKGSRLRSLLVVFQFAISIVLITCTIIIFNQQRYMKNKDLGFNKNNLLAIALQNKEVRADLETFKNELLKIDGVVAVCTSSMVPGEFYLFNTRTFPEGFSGDQVFLMENFLIDQDFFKTFEIEIVKGRGFSKHTPTDLTDAVMINETAARKLEWQDPLGKTIHIVTSFGSDMSQTIKRRVIGVYKDMHHKSLYSAIEPSFVRYVSNEGAIENRARRLTLRFQTDDLAGLMKMVEQKWQEVFPSIPYYSFFLDDFYDSQHLAEEKLGNIFLAFAIFALVIGCLGLFGLSSFTTEQRTKEIGIRKTLGSSVSSIIVLLCKDFVRLILLANIAAWPIAFFAMKKWLQNFPYPVQIGLNTFVLTSFLALIIALATVGYQSVKAARANPVESLRYE